MVEHRKEYLDTMTSLQDRMLTSPSQYLPPFSSTLPPIIRVFHDESTLQTSPSTGLMGSEIKVVRAGGDGI